MDDQTSLVLALQLVALCCIACALVLYLLCRIRGRYDNASADVGSLAGSLGGDPAGIPVDVEDGSGYGLAALMSHSGTQNIGSGRAVLVTCCDTALGLQLAMHLSNRGFRVFAGLKKGAIGADGECSDPSGQDAVCARLLRAHAKQQEALQSHGDLSSCESPGSLILVPMDVTREDILHDAVDVIRRHLPAGHDGLHAVINTAGLCARGRLEAQENAHWDALLKVNVVGALRTARTFLPLLRNKKGRLVNVGAGGGGAGLVAYTAARYAVEGATNALRHEMAPLGVSVISLQPPEGAQGESLFLPPRLRERAVAGEPVAAVAVTDYDVNVLGGSALRTVEEVLLTPRPRHRYQLMPPRLLARATLAACVSKVADKFLHFPASKDKC